MNFKTQFQEDIKVFLNLDEFADEIVFEESGFTKRINSLLNEIISNNDVATTTYFSVASTDVEKISTSSTITLGDIKYGVISWQEEAGITDILVQRT